jgi:hypothetical protein
VVVSCCLGCRGSIAGGSLVWMTQLGMWCLSHRMSDGSRECRGSVGDIVSWLCWAYRGSVGLIVAQLSISWLSWAYCGSVGHIVAQLGKTWLSWANRGSVGNIVVPLGILWLSWAYRGSVGDIAALFGISWLNCRCG